MQSAHADSILIREVIVDAVIGVHDWERRQTQRLQIDLGIELDLRTAGLSDALADTLDYEQLLATVHAVAAGAPALIETLAERVAAELLEEPRVQAVTVEVRKPAALRGACAAVRIRRSRD